jgi:hypothetical protein
MSAQVVITRKSKKTRWLLHAVAFAATGGTSAIVSAPVIASTASYNARTERLVAENTPKPSKPVKPGKLSAEDIAYMKAHTAGRSAR